MDKFTKKKVFVGIDISKDELALSLLKEESYGKYVDKRIKNSFDNFKDITQWLNKNKVSLKESLFCMEHTGTYGLMLCAWLSQMKADFVVESGLRIKRSLGITRGKNDQIDARRIADYVFSNRAKLEPFSMPSDLMLKLKQLLTYRDQLSRSIRSYKNSLKSHQEYQKLSGLTSITGNAQAKIKMFQKDIKLIEEQIMDLIQSDEQLIKNYNLATSVKGVGFVIAAFMQVSANNFSSFENGRKYACHVGIAPFEHTSGTSIQGKTRVSNLANKKMKALLSNGANSSYKWDPEMRNYYKRKIAEGKDHKLVINSISCKLVNRVFAVLKRQTPFVVTYKQNFG